MNLANKLTVFRVILVIIMMIFSLLTIKIEFYGIGLTAIILDVIFIIASFTDTLDGYIARSRNQITTFGKFLDPIADKILVITAMVILVQFQKLPAWIPAIVIMREFVVSGYRLVAVEKNGQVIAASIWGKVKTVSQMIAIAVAFIDIYSFGAIFTENITGIHFFINLITTVFMLISVIATVISGYDYIKDWKKVLD
ncbi:MAG: CDP-diacylglycerol--glycerol-3-phosphate 3-phosphatidyltransferase [Clostridia bacterium]|nr:CDP-diacylglycerol--glycerol-3-phosphate 3-phosphatidyltransferase [Clostridia bacterium]